MTELPQGWKLEEEVEGHYFNWLVSNNANAYIRSVSVTLLEKPEDFKLRAEKMKQETIIRAVYIQENLDQL